MYSSPLRQSTSSSSLSRLVRARVPWCAFSPASRHTSNCSGARRTRTGGLLNRLILACCLTDPKTRKVVSSTHTRVPWSRTAPCTVVLTPRASRTGYHQIQTWKLHDGLRRCSACHDLVGLASTVRLLQPPARRDSRVCDNTNRSLFSLGFCQVLDLELALTCMHCVTLIDSHACHKDARRSPGQSRSKMCAHVSRDDIVVVLVCGTSWMTSSCRG